MIYGHWVRLYITRLNRKNHFMENKSFLVIIKYLSYNMQKIQELG